MEQPRWNCIYNQTPLIHTPYHFANVANSPFMMRYLTTVLKHCPRGGRTLETGIGTGHGAILLSKRGTRRRHRLQPGDRRTGAAGEIYETSNA